MSDKMVKIKIGIQGSTPLLCNRFLGEEPSPLPTGTGSSIKHEGLPRDEAEQLLYGDPKKPVIPGPNMFKSIIEAGRYFKIGRKFVTNAKNSMIPGCMELTSLELPIKHSKPWEVDRRPIRNPATGGRRMKSRPRFDDWSLSFEVTLDTSIMPVDLAYAIVEAAGKRIGLGDFRPDCKGMFGKFRIVEWKATPV